ncbi:MAG: sigma-70 family polymerase sigma factor [Xanthomonadaceae bacterium]|nr:sigma-70 family polymerase sigma factor [Xanthomonadaceae bacterium]
MLQPTDTRRASHEVCDAQDDARLMSRVALEDIAAFETIYRAYYPRLTRFLRRMLRHGALVDEVLDDTMMIAWRKAHTWDGSSRLSTWLFAIAYRQALKALRRSVPTAELVDEPAVSPDTEPDAQMQRWQLHEQLGAALATLSVEHRAVMELTYYQGYSCREIAEITGCPVATVKTRMFYARRKLKSLLLTQRGEQAL